MPAWALAPEREPALEPARAQVLALAREPALAWATAMPSVMERSGRVRRFHNLPLRGHPPPGIPLIPKCVEH